MLGKKIAALVQADAIDPHFFADPLVNVARQILGGDGLIEAVEVGGSAVTVARGEFRV